MSSGRTLSHEEARHFYDRFGARQDTQVFYEGPPLADLVAHADFDRARSVCELGCGTGRLAAELLAGHLPADARYVGIDASETMVGLARERTRRFGDRVEIVQSDGSLKLALPDARFDRFVSTYVLDLLSEADVRTVVAEARRLLVPDGRLCLVGLTPGTTALTRAVTLVWEGVHRLRPSLVGGCRPLALTPFLPATEWQILHRAVRAPFALASEVIVASPRHEGQVRAGDSG